MRRLRLPGVVLLALGFLSCAAEDAAMDAPPGCTSDLDCPEGETCFEDGCGPALDFAVRITPLQGGSYSVQDFSSVSVALSRMDLSLRGGGTLEGDLKLKTGTTETSYTGKFTVQARGRSSNIPGLEFEQPLSQTFEGTSRYSLAVPAGIWDLTLTPTSPDLPPVYAQRRVASGEVVDPKLMLAPDSLVTYRGSVVPSKGQTWPADAVPVLRARVLDPRDGRSLSQAVTFSANQVFELHAFRTDAEVVLRIAADATSPVAVPTNEFSSNGAGVFVESEFALGDYGTRVDVSGEVRDAFEAPLANVDLQFEGPVKGGGTYVAGARSDAEGRFVVSLFPTPTEYQVRALPPAGSSVASTVVSFQVAGPRDGVIVRCPPKARLTGVVGGPKSKGERPLEGVFVSYEGNPLASQPGVSEGNVKTDAQGRFEVLVEPGAYRVIAKPPTDRRLPWSARHVEAPGEVTLQVSEVREVAGSVTAWKAGGLPETISNARVSIYRVSENTSVLVYETLSDNFGQFKAFLPKGQSFAEGR